MAFIYKDRVKQITTTTGTTSPLVLSTTPTGFQAFSVVGDGNTCHYTLLDVNGIDWEIGVGTYTLSGTTLARTTVLTSSAGGTTKITLSATGSTVFLTPDATAIGFLDTANTFTAQQTLTTPILGTPASGTLTSCTGLPAAGVVGTAMTLAGGTLTGNITLGENTSIALDPAGSADGKYSGITIAGTGGATIAVGELVTLDKDDSRWELVDISVAAAATGDARGIIGIAATTSTDGGAITVLLHGTMRADAKFPALTIGAAVYASTAGAIVVAQPTTTDYVIRVVGHALTADEIMFNPSSDWITHT